MKRRLATLYQLGYLERPVSQKLIQGSGSFLIYSIGKKGAELLARKELVGTRISSITFPNLMHAMMISRFRVALTLALRNYPTKPKIVRWVMGYDLKDLLSERGEKTELVPDAFFTIEEGDDLLHFFLEADRSTMTRERVLSKMKIYWDWWRSEKCKNSLGVTRFRVLTITISEERKENLSVITKNADTRQEGSNMFLFASEKSYSLEKPEAMLSPIWGSPKDGTLHAILE